ncbi:hypothetical protein [Qipengyuania sp. DGS5-3]|uniref:hypothetical protein n=1 Tax=Qipengyuania sp. DGS5-3 TaxID=3349632 RepID=UPI0036D22FE8
MVRLFLLVTASAGCLAIASQVNAQSSTETYTYDAQGRLIKVETAGGSNDKKKSVICYDKAGNRKEYKAASGNSQPTCPPTQ